MITSNKCPRCSGELTFDVDSQNLKCSHCSTIHEFEKAKSPLQKKLLTKTSSITESKTKYTQFACQTCGRKHISATDTPLLRCPSCGDDDLTKTLKIEFTPDGIIPFKISKSSAQSHFQSWLKNRHFAPNALKKSAKSRVLDGFYLPGYFYDFTCQTQYSGVGVNSYRSANGQIRVTRHPFHKTQTNKFSDRVESATSSISSAKMRQLGGFSSSNLQVYRTEYLYGWFASQADSSVQDNSQNMIRSVTQEIALDVRSKLPYSSVENFHCSTSFSDILYFHVYLPVYKGIYRYKKRDFSYYINGENGRVAGKAPKSFWKIFLFILTLTTSLALIAYLFYLSR